MEARFKDQVPDVKDSDRKVWFDAGAVSVVRHLKFIKAKQEENILNITETIT